MRLRLTTLLACSAIALSARRAAPQQAVRPFGLGDSGEAVRAAEGVPEVVERLASLGVEIWTYRGSSVRFDMAAGRVTGWDDPSHRLHVRLDKRGGAGAGREIVIGSGGADVARLLGAPSGVRRTGAADRWSYGRAFIALSIDDGRVIGWYDPARRLPVRRTQDREAAAALSATPPRTGAPPRLLVHVALRDTSGEGRSAGAANDLVVTIENAGPGTAFSVSPTVRLAEGNAQVRAGDVEPVSSLAAGASVTRRIPVELDAMGRPARVTFIVGASEANGFDAEARASITIDVAAAQLPRFVLDHVSVQDQSGDGRLSPREIGDVEVVLLNAGAVAATGLTAQLVLGPGVFAVAGTPPRFQLAVVPPGGRERVSFSIYTNARAESASVALAISGRSGRLLQRVDVPLRLERAPLAGQLPAQPRETGRATPSPDDVDAGAPFDVPRNDRALAVVFGIDRYRALPPARFAARDALTMRGYAVRLLGVPDDADHLYLRVDADATGNEFRKAFGATGWLARRATSQSDVLIYFAGHGAASPDGAPLVLPWDADANYAMETGYPLADMYEALARIPAHSITIVLDACFAGLTRSGAPLRAGTRPIVLSVEHPALLRQGMTLLAAAQGAEAAGDLPSQQHGIFTYYLLRGLRGDADSDADGRVTVGELQRYLTAGVPAAARSQDREQHPLVIARDTSRTLVRRPERP